MEVWHPRRIITAHVEQLGEEICVYDWSRHRVHRLNPAAPSVWPQCDGKTTPAEMIARLPAH